MDKLFIQAIVGDKSVLGVCSKVEFNEGLLFGFPKGLSIENPVAFQRMIDPRSGSIQVAALSFFTLNVLGKAAWCSVTSAVALGDVVSCATGTECPSSREYYTEYQATLEQMRVAKLQKDTGIVLPK